MVWTEEGSGEDALGDDAAGKSSLTNGATAAKRPAPAPSATPPDAPTTTRHVLGGKVEGGVENMDWDQLSIADSFTTVVEQDDLLFHDDDVFGLWQDNVDSGVLSMTTIKQDEPSAAYTSELAPGCI